MEIRLSLNSTSQERTQKGKSLIAFPANYTIIDLETTGCSPLYDDIIEIAAIKVCDNKIVDQFSSLVNKNGQIYVDSFISELTGITQEMIDSAPDIQNILPSFLEFISNDVLIGHNVNFDINFLYDASESIMGKPLVNDFIDTMRISRRLHPEQAHHRLKDLAERYSIDYNNAHRSLADCEITKYCFDSLKKDILRIYVDFDEFITAVTYHSHGVRAKDILSSVDSFDKSHILYGKVCVFTGTLEKITRKDAMQIVVNLGGINGDSVTKKTNYLILGCNDYCKSIKDGKSSKQKKAEALQLKGSDIEVISEDVFYEMVGLTN